MKSLIDAREILGMISDISKTIENAGPKSDKANAVIIRKIKEAEYRIDLAYESIKCVKVEFTRLIKALKFLNVK